MQSLMFSFHIGCFQKWHSKMPSSIQWMSGLSRGVSTKVALRLFVVTLCVLITLLMAILNYVSCFSIQMLWAQPSLCETHRLFPFEGFPPGEQLHSTDQQDRARGSQTLHRSCEFIKKKKKGTFNKILPILSS